MLPLLQRGGMALFPRTFKYEKKKHKLRRKSFFALRNNAWEHVSLAISRLSIELSVSFYTDR